MITTRRLENSPVMVLLSKHTLTIVKPVSHRPHSHKSPSSKSVHEVTHRTTLVLGGYWDSIPSGQAECVPEAQLNLIALEVNSDRCLTSQALFGRLDLAWRCFFKTIDCLPSSIVNLDHQVVSRYSIHLLIVIRFVCHYFDRSNTLFLPSPHKLRLPTNSTAF